MGAVSGFTRSRVLSAAIVALMAPAISTAQFVKPAAELGLADLATNVPVLVLESDPTAIPVEPRYEAQFDAWGLFRARLAHRSASLLVRAERGDRLGCPDEGFSTRAYARDSGNDWPWLPANTLVVDDLNLAAGDWVIGCYDLLIYADNSAAYGCNASRTVTVRAYDACNGNVIPGSVESWTVPPHGGPVLLTGVTNINFEASGTIWFGLTTSSNECDGWYLGQQQVEGSTTNVFQLADDCAACINPPTCHPWAGFIVVLYGCQLPQIVSPPADAVICADGWHQFCVNASGTGTLDYQWQLAETDIPGATAPCYVATLPGDYRCIVTDDCGTRISSSATLTTRSGPAITAQPSDGVSCPAYTHEVCVAVDAIGDATFQWKRNGLTIIGATAACYPATDPGTYTCAITDDCGTTTSASANVSITAPSSGDFNGDAQTDLADYTRLEMCMSGPGVGTSTECTCVDADGDADADLGDFTILQIAFGG